MTRVDRARGELRMLLALSGVVLTALGGFFPTPVAAEPVLFTVDPLQSSAQVTYFIEIFAGDGLELVLTHGLSGTINADVQIAEAGGSSVFQATFGGAIEYSDESAMDQFLSNVLTITTQDNAGPLFSNPVNGSAGPTNYVFDLGGLSVLGITEGTLTLVGDGNTIGPVNEVVDLASDSISVSLTSPTLMNLTAADLGNNMYDVSISIPVAESQLVEAASSGFPVDFTFDIVGTIVADGVLDLPEPSATPLLAAGVAFVAALARRRRRL